MARTNAPCAHCAHTAPLPAGEDRPTSFRKMLANTCQEEYEATEEARKVGSGAAAPAAGSAVRRRAATQWQGSATRGEGG